MLSDFGPYGEANFLLTFTSLVAQPSTQAFSHTAWREISWRHRMAYRENLSGKTDFHCKIKETFLIQELKPSLNVNVSSEKLLLF